jgi:hypothetical protein
MSNRPDKLIERHLRRIDVGLDGIKDEMAELRLRLGENAVQDKAEPPWMPHSWQPTQGGWLRWWRCPGLTRFAPGARTNPP